MSTGKKRNLYIAIAVTAYVAVVLLVDFTDLIWRTRWGFDTFKFLFWFVVPFALCLRWMDWGALGFKRWKRVDLAILAVMVALGFAAVLVIQFVPALRDYYPSMANAPAVVKQRYFIQNLAWWASWPGKARILSAKIKTMSCCCLTRPSARGSTRRDSATWPRLWHPLRRPIR